MVCEVIIPYGRPSTGPHCLVQHAGYHASAGRRLLVASLGVGEPLTAHTPGEGSLGPLAWLAYAPVSCELCRRGINPPYPHSLVVASRERRVDEDADSAEILPPMMRFLVNLLLPAPAKTVRVKFVLKKQYAFGQQFLVVVEDPALGLWDPAKATALDWSEGHVWTAKTVLPANRLIEFKFLLRDASGYVRWQHGANRTLQITETPNTLVVHEDWNHAKNQKLSEEEELSIRAEDVPFSDDLAGSNGAMLAGKLQTDDNQETNMSAAVADASVHGETMGANEANQHQVIRHSILYRTAINRDNRTAFLFVLNQLIFGKDQKILDELRGEASMVPQNRNPSADDNAGRNDDGTTLCQEGAALPVNKSNSIFENDLAWARKALQQLLRILGFQIGTTRT
ncbi:uncharacterized protein LOC133885734 [Phragmites australis]|uniref:uncharacterized protein LOC133885734 n=1 Tax=Phragmites australis TaxID=29695 RepID=UPI002D777C62|nr:uncharacterized protein LOC133885734 [Phragmites australis]